MLGNMQDVFHHLVGMGEYNMIDALENITAFGAILLFGDQEMGVIDMSAAVKTARDRCALKGKGGNRLINLLAKLLTCHSHGIVLRNL